MSVCFVSLASTRRAHKSLLRQNRGTSDRRGCPGEDGGGENTERCGGWRQRDVAGTVERTAWGGVRGKRHWDGERQAGRLSLAKFLGNSLQFSFLINAKFR